MNGAVQSAVLRAASTYIYETFDVSRIVTVMDDDEPAVWSDHSLTWYVEALTPDVTDAIGVTVTLDAFGTFTVAPVEGQRARLQHVYPDVLPWE